MRSFGWSILALFALAGLLAAQSPMPVVVPATTSMGTSTGASKASPATANADSIPAALKMLREMKAANEETLRKQAATLEQLDELAKTADQIRIYTKRS